MTDTTEPTDPKPPGGSAPEPELVPADDRVIGVAFRWSLIVLAFVAAVVLVLVLALRPHEVVREAVVTPPVATPAPLPAPPPEAPRLPYRDITAESGLGFVHFNGATGEKLLPETMGSGAAFLDVDGDGDQDLLLSNGRPWPGAPLPSPPPTPALYLNDGAGRFTDVTSAWGLDVPIQGTGVAAADFDGDGDVDVFLGAVGADLLLRNDGGRFTDVTAAAGVAGGAQEWTSGAGFFDADGDGDLDLLALRYVAWSRDIDLALHFTLNGTDRAYGPPTQHAGTSSRFFRNEGDGTFTDRTGPAGFDVRNVATGEAVGKGLGLAFVDCDGDARLDVIVANDTVRNFLFRSRGDGSFEELGVRSGLAYDAEGRATGAMGIDAADLGGDGRLAIAIANFANESTSLYAQQKPLLFADVAEAWGVGSESRLRLSFGLFFFDADLDGRLDLLQANGHLEDTIGEVQPSQSYRQPAQLFWNAGRTQGGRFIALPDDSIADLARPIVGRGAAFADIDADGDLDVLLTQVAGAPLLLRNEQALGHHWLRVRLLGRAPNTDAIGASVELVAAGGVQRRLVAPSRSYLSQVELPLTFGLGAATAVERLGIRWPDGTREDVVVAGVDRLLEVREAKAP